MLAKRIIPCLDVKDGRTVKGVNFVSLRDAGSALELASFYSSNGADELVFLDITATVEGRGTLISLVRDVSRTISIPFTVGGGIRSEGDVDSILGAGADKISVNSSAIRNPGLIDTLAKRFGSQCVVLALDVRSNPAMPRAMKLSSTEAGLRQGLMLFHGHQSRSAVEQVSCFSLRWIKMERRMASISLRHVFSAHRSGFP